jgi:ubiquinone/menaquinone biosynthesis C-methylase UbiE
MVSQLPDAALPEYAARLDALHRALESDFRAILGHIPLAPNATIADAGCGDGFFTGLLARRVPRGLVIGLDSSSAFLGAARTRLSELIAAGRCRVAEGDAAAMPFESASVDAIFSAHSMQSYESIPAVLAECRRVLKPSGVLAVLESDNVHSIMLSWPPDLELAIRQAEHREIGDEDSYLGAYFPRFAPRMFHEAGLEDFRRDYVFIQRQRADDFALSEYITSYIDDLADTLGDALSEPYLDRLRQLTDPNSRAYLPRQDNFFFGSLQTLITARAPRDGQGERRGASNRANYERNAASLE